jgi:pimeloyl-ACP methyl ester carboxylesterase
MPPLVLDPSLVPAADPSVEPEGFVVVVDPGDRIHFLDWGGPPDSAQRPGVLLIHGVAQTAWVWTPIARRLRAGQPVVALDLRGHGLSDAPTSGYDEVALAEDVVAVADGSGLLASGPVVLAGHGFGGVVAAWTAAALGDRCAGLVLVDGGWEDLTAATGQTPDEFLRTLDEPPEVLRSMTAFLADRAAFDPPTWDADQERAARATVVETHAGRVVPATRPHALAGAIHALFDYRPAAALAGVSAPIAALVAADDEEGGRRAALEDVQRALTRAGRPAIRVASFPRDGHNLMRYRSAEVAAAILAVASGTTTP